MKLAGSLLLAMAASAFSAGAAVAPSTARLVWGGDWNEAGAAVRRTMSGEEFKSAAKGRYKVEFLEEAGSSPCEGNLGSLKLPCIFLLSPKGNCCFVWDAVSARLTAAQIAGYLDKADAARLAAEAKGLDTADECGEFLSRMERYVGGPRRVVSPGFYPDVFEKLKSLDPADETGWQRRFTLGVEFDKSSKADGLELVIRANKFREDGDFDGGRAFVEAEMKKPRSHLSKEQLQAVLMAKFALFRDNAEMKDDLDRALEKIAAYDEMTFWGTAALGWLNKRGKPPLSVYWGWRGDDFSGKNFTRELRYGVQHSFKRPGEYEIAFENSSGEAVKFRELVLMCGKDRAAKPLANPRREGGRFVFSVFVPRSLAGKITSISVRGDASGASSGIINVHRRVLRPRGQAK